MKSASTAPIVQLPEDPPNGVTGGLDWARDDHAVSMVDERGRELVRRSVEHSSAGLKELLNVLTRADQHVFTSLPRSGRVRAARPLAEIGDCRARFPTPEALACLAGAAPSTRQSGRTRTVNFRWACDKQLRDAVTDFAADSRKANPWAADLYARARARGHDHPHAVRILARAWLFVIWHCWQDRVAYDTTRHHALPRTIQDQKTAA